MDYDNNLFKIAKFQVFLNTLYTLNVLKKQNNTARIKRSYAMKLFLSQLILNFRLNIFGSFCCTFPTRPSDIFLSPQSARRGSIQILQEEIPPGFERTARLYLGGKFPLNLIGQLGPAPPPPKYQKAVS
jgi:hypothetical protein